ncbi:MAG: cation:proton antiporter [Gemmatimonadota bacterium]|nr:cation:proton antiporter [Gemmatimonadota bacterium]
MRRAAILALLFAGMQLILPLKTDENAGVSPTLLLFGFLILAAYTIGELATPLTLPRITGFLFAGIVFGPSVLGVLSMQSVEELAPVSRLAIALIAFLAGAELRWGELRERARLLLAMMGFELALSFVSIAGLLLALRAWVPFLEGGWPEIIALAALFAAVAVVHSPAVVMALLTETRARGPVARTTLGIVLMTDVVVVLIFSGVLAIARAIIPSSGGPELSAGLLAWEIGGSLIVGAVLGGATSLYLRFVRSELFLFAIIVAFLGAEIANLLHVETLLTLLVAGFVTENATKRGSAELLHAMERSAAPVFVVFFALAGASIALGELASIWPLAVGIVAVRMLAIWGGCAIGARMGNASLFERRYTWMGLIAQAGVAIGLVTVIAEAYPERGAAMRTLFLSVIAINQLVGPILARLALVRSGEVSAEPEQPAATSPVAQLTDR